MLGRQQPDEIKEIAGLALPGLGLVCLLQGHDLQTLKRQEMSVLPFPPPPSLLYVEGVQNGLLETNTLPRGQCRVHSLGFGGRQGWFGSWLCCLLAGCLIL